MQDNRFIKLAKGLVNYSVAVKPSDKVLIEASDIAPQLILELVKEVYKKGAKPFVEIFDPKIQRAILQGLEKAHADDMAKYASYRMKEMDCYIGIRGGKNSFETSDVNPKRMQVYSKNYAYPVHHILRVQKTRWVVLRYPNESMAQLAGKSTKAFEDFYFSVCNLDYSKMDNAMDPLVALMAKTDKVQIKGQGTDLTFSIKGISSKKCSGHNNIPDGEVYTAPVKNSVNGVIQFNAPSISQGTKFENIFLRFENGRCVEAASNDTKKLNSILNTDEGARYIGEFAFGLNPHITKPIGDILFDEKIAGSIHLAMGSSYEDAFNGNESAIHWDMVLMQDKNHGGGEVYFDEVLIRKDGKFVLKELEALNNL